MTQHGPFLVGSYNYSLVALSVVIAILSAYATLDLAGRVSSARRRARLIWMTCGAVAMGNGIWSMHYIGMLAFRLPVHVEYDWPTVLVSLMAAIAASGVGLFVVGRVTMGRPAIIAGSICMGIGISAMHYIGMEAMRLPAMCVYSFPLVLLSIFLAIVISFVALLRAFALRDNLSSWSYGKVANATILGAAIPVMHYVGMAAANFYPAPLSPSSLHHAIRISDIGLISITLVTLAVLSLVYLTSIAGRTFSRQSLELAGSEQRYRQIVESTFNAFLEIGHKGLITGWNAQAQKIFGWERKEAIGKPVDEIIFWRRDDQTEEEGLTALLDANGNVPLLTRFETTARHREGARFPIEIALSSFQLGQNRHFAAFVHDVTERKLDERAREEATEAAEAGSRAKSEFLANMSHEIRTPLNGVIGMTDLVLETELNTEQREYLETVKLSADALLSVINDILDFSKIEAGKVEIDKIPFDLRECIEATLKALALRADEKGLELLCDVSPELPEMVVGDPGRLRQVITNLVGNAVKFTNDGEVALRVQASRDEMDSLTLHFVVSDTGIGIAKEKLESIFDSFVQADTSTTRQYGGTGLGLTISKWLTELMNGKIWVESQLNHGSHFHFTIRALKAESTIVVPRNNLLLNDALAGIKVLVIDDNRTNRRILEGILKSWGMNPTVVSSGEQALTCLSGNDPQGPYGLILMDMHMPKMDGFGVVDAIRERGGAPTATIMMLSSGGHTGDAVRCRQLGIAAYLLKPIRQAELQQAIKRVLQANESPEPPSMVTKDSLRAERDPAMALNILLAEDNAVNQRLAVRLIEKRGHKVLAVPNGREAISGLEKDHYDLILMDVQMPEMDGIEATIAIRTKEKASGKHQPIVAMTALVMTGDRERCLAAGMDGYLSKPLQASELDDILETYGSRKKAAQPQECKASGRLQDSSIVSDSIPNIVIQVDELLERVEGDSVFLSELWEIFRADCPRQLQAIADAIAQEDAHGVKRASHALKGALSNLAATKARNTAAILEQMAAHNNLAGAGPVLRQLEEELNEVIALLGSLCQETPR